MDVIIIEDDPSTGEIYQRALEKRNYETHLIAHGEDAVSYFENKDNVLPTVVVLDINLPGYSGIYILRLLREKLNLIDLKIIVSSANLLAKNAPEMKLADAFLSKPCSPRKLAVMVASMMELDSPSPQPAD